MGRYNDFMMVQAEKPELSKLLRDWLGRDTETRIAAEDVSVVANLLIAYGIVEEAFLLYAKKWIDEETWGQWAAWLKDLTKHPRFDLIHRRMRGQFDRRFQDYVSKVLEDK
jgi:predicted RNA polymerase sigma factor